jgi:hypothetical protein
MWTSGTEDQEKAAQDKSERYRIGAARVMVAGF